MDYVERSFLFVPGDRSERFEKAKSSGSDAIIIDLEDAVTPENKRLARENALRYLQAGNRAFIRINAAGSEWFEADLQVIADGRCAGAFLSKAESAQQVAAVAGCCASVYPIIESARGFRNLQAISQAPGVKRLAFGTLDFSLDTGMADNDRVLIAVRTEIVLTSRLAGLQPPIDGVTTEFRNTDRTVLDATHSREMGFGGKLCIHPAQVPCVNNIFGYSDEEIAWADNILSLSQSSYGAVSDNGKMVDKPVLEKAKRILAHRFS